MSRIKKISPRLNLTNFQTFILDNNPLSQYLKISELSDLLTSGKNGFLIEGSTFLKPSTEIKIEVLDTEGNPLYVEPGEGIPEYYEGLSKLISVYVYEDTPIGIGKITILAELDSYIDESGFVTEIPEDWKNIYNIKWERDIKINKNIPNETRVRFVKRPQIIIEELNESFYSRDLVTATQSDNTVRGIALTPSEGTSFIGYRGGVKYLIQKESGTFNDGGTYISINDLNLQNLEILEYLNESTVVVQTPYTSSAGVVSNFTGKSYSLTYQYNESPVASSILGSFGRFEINNLQTFVGDVERIKVFKKSRASNVDYEVIQDTRVSAAELLNTIVSGSNINTGYFSASYEGNKSWNNFWVTQSLSGAELDSSKIYKAVKLQNNRLSTNLGDDIRLESGSEYTLEFYNYYETSLNDANDTLNVYLTSTERSGSGISNYYLTQSIVNLSGSNQFRNANKLSYNFYPPITDNWTVHFEVDNTTANSYWHVGSVSLKASDELGFSPDEFSFIIPIDRDLERETFDFKFEFFDINNNYVPIIVNSAQTFQSGNIGLIDKNVIVDVDKQFFNFSSSLEGLPPSQSISITGTKNRILGNLLITSQAFDTGGIEIPTSSYIGSEYPGRLDFFEQDLYSLSASLDISKFTGSLHNQPTQSSDIIVDRITYTLTETESSQPFIKRFTVNRLVAGASGTDGTNSRVLSVSANTNQFIYEPTGPSLKPTGQIILIDVKKQNLVSGSASPNFFINSSSNYPLTPVGSETNGVLTFSLNGTDFPYSAGEVTYAFTGSDELSNLYSDFVKITPVMNFDAVSIVLSNESTAFPATSVGNVTSAELDEGDGEVFVRVGSNEIDHSDGLTTGNRFDIVEITASGCTANSTSPTTNSYGISAMSADSASLDMLIRYKAGDNSTTVDFRKIVSYSKVKKAAPILSITSTPKDQSVSAKSTGEQIDSFSNVTVTVSETYNGSTSNKTITSLTATSSDITSISTTAGSGLVTLNGKTLANGTNSTTVAITAVVTDSESVSRTLTDTLALSKIKKAAPVVVANLSSEAQTVTKTEAGVYGTPATFTISVNEGGSNYSYSTGGGINTYYVSSISGGTNNSGTITPTTPTSTAGTTVSMTISYVNSEGTAGTITKTHNVGVASDGTTGDNGAPGANGVVINITPTSQVVKRSTSGTYATPSTFTVSVTENGSLLTHQAGSGTPATSKFTITSLTNGSESSGAGTTSYVIQPSTPTDINGFNVTFNVTYTDSKGTTSSAIAQIHRVNAVLDGTTGPGVVHTGVWEAGRTYQYSDGLTSGTGRRDTVLWSSNGSTPYDTYYAVNSSHTSTNDSNSSTGRPDLGGPWTSLGTQDFFVAAKIGVFEDSFVQNTLNIGSNSNGGLSSANITLAGGTAYPYLSIGQASATGSQGYDVTGIFLGSVNVGGSPKYRFSLKNSAGTNYLRWTGDGLEIRGSLLLDGGTGVQDALNDKYDADNPNGYQNNGDSKTGGAVGGWSISNTAIYRGNVGSDGVFTSQAGAITLGAGFISSNQFYISSSGDTVFQGRLSAAGGTFTGTLVAAGGYFSGSIAATSGYIGNWVLTGPTLYASANNKKVQLAANTPSVELYSGTSLVVDINANTSLSPKSSTAPTFGASSIGVSYPPPNAGYFTYNNINGSTYEYDNTTGFTGGSTSFTVPAGSGNIGKTCIISANIGGSGGATFQASGDDTNPPVLLVFQRLEFAYGFRLTTPSSTYDANTNYAEADTLMTLGQNEISMLYPTTNDSITLVLEEGTYTITPYIKNIYASATLQGSGYPAIFSLYINVPSLSSIESSIPVSKTELAAGGFQVVYSNTRFLEVQRANNADFVSVGGGLTCTGDVTANTSDIRLKENIRVIENPLEKIENIRGVYFNYTADAIQKTGYTNENEQVGFIAQEVQEVLPHIVKPAPFDKDQSTGKSISGENYLTIQYEKIVPLLLEGIKELKKEIEELKKDK